ncbi:amino acid permease [Neobacillus sp. WH10]|uniref:amino acid permease n=1 Tax=Neobacillus sp. WH10 TaxID=3047873 RepID=UPI0032E010AF
MIKLREPQDLVRGLKDRHIQMIALGGAIGTGLFYGSAEAIKLAGPSIILAYVIGGLIMFLIMRALGEMLVEEPVSGAFSALAHKYWGDFPGFLLGWNYWFAIITVSIVELIVLGNYFKFWLPNMPTWITALVFVIVFFLINITNVKFFGEFEFWAALIKVVAIIAMIIFGLGILFFGVGASNFKESGFENMWINGGFLPNGGSGLLMSLVLAMFAFGGIEMVGMTAAEAENHRITLPKSINNVVLRILVFYIGSMVVLVSLFPWNKVGLEGSPFVQIFSAIGIPAAATLLNVIVITAAASAYNSAIYSTSRMIYGLSLQRNAPKIFNKIGKTGTPVNSTILCSMISLIGILLLKFLPEKAFMYMMSITTFASIFNWIMILFILLHWRKKKSKEEITKFTFKMPLYPYSIYFSIVGLLVIIATMFFLSDYRIALYIGPFWIILLFVLFKIRAKRDMETGTSSHPSILE